jgi:hypothetical protein
MPENFKNVVNGLTLVDSSDHYALANYGPHIQEAEPFVHVVEMATGRARHLGNKLIVFGRLISVEEHNGRIKSFIEDPIKFQKGHLRSLGE